MTEISATMMRRVANAYNLGVSEKDIHDMLCEQYPDMSEFDIFLAYCAGKVLADSIIADKLNNT